MDGYYGFSLGDFEFAFFFSTSARVCMAFYESSFNTRKVGRSNRNGGHDYGIFQINSHYWCNSYQGHTANGCNKPCSGK
ncbi:hypothetical protein Chor_007046 [Crotalus horridus]